MLPMLFHFKHKCPKIKDLCVNAIINATSHLYTCYEFWVFTSALSLLATLVMFAAVIAVLSI